ncbi:MAG: phosphoribosyltransferase family protein [Gemmataceae bacterium]|nr:phosphoribosyltransferase family protein [Gemmataceae bacterium]
MFRDRRDAALQLAAVLKRRPLHRPVVLAIPRGGVVTGAILAHELGAELDVVLSRKLRAPHQPEYALGAVCEDGHVYLNPHVREELAVSDAYIEKERRLQLHEIARRQKLFRAVRPRADLADRSVIVTDDGIATGATMIAALQTARGQGPRELLVAVPVAAPDRWQEILRWCDDGVCLATPAQFWAVGQFYEDFSPVEDEEALAWLRSCQDDSKSA